MDRYTFRLFEKLGFSCASYQEIQEAVHKAAAASSYEYGNLHACIVRLSVQKETQRLVHLLSTEDTAGGKKMPQRHPGGEDHN